MHEEGKDAVPAAAFRRGRGTLDQGAQKLLVPLHWAPRPDKLCCARIKVWLVLHNRTGHWVQKVFIFFTLFYQSLIPKKCSVLSSFLKKQHSVLRPGKVQRFLTICTLLE